MHDFGMVGPVFCLMVHPAPDGSTERL
jgi:hypothetical protein